MATVTTLGHRDGSCHPSSTPKHFLQQPARPVRRLLCAVTMLPYAEPRAQSLFFCCVRRAPLPNAPVAFSRHFFRSTTQYRKPYDHGREGACAASDPSFHPIEPSKTVPTACAIWGGAPVVFVEPAGVALPAATAVRTMPKSGRSASHSHCKLETIVLDALPFAQHISLSLPFPFPSLADRHAFPKSLYAIGMLNRPDGRNPSNKPAYPFHSAGLDAALFLHFTCIL